MNRRDVIQQIIDTIGARNYLEIGVNEGRVFLRIKAAHKVAVDPDFAIAFRRRLRWAMRNLRSEFYEITSDEYFAGPNSAKRFDAAFIDGLHTYRQSLRDVENTLRVLNQGGVIVMHDCNPTNERLASPTSPVVTNAADMDLGWCGDVWKAVCHLRTFHPDLRVFVLDCDFGLGIVTHGKPESVLKMTRAELNQLTYADLEKDRQRLLNLKPESYFAEFLAELRGRGQIAQATSVG